MRDTYDIFLAGAPTIAGGRDEDLPRRYRKVPVQRDVFRARYRHGQATKGIAYAEIALRLGLKHASAEPYV